MNQTQSPELLQFIVERIDVGLFIVDTNMNVMLWNRFMEINSQIKSKQIIGKNLFETFPDLPQKWFEKKIKSVFLLKGFSFVSWEQRAYIFKFPHNRPITGGVEYMYQNLVLMPVKDAQGHVDKVCIALHDVTDVGFYQSELQRAMHELEVLSRVDGLTRLNNRHHWEERLSEEFSRVKRYGGNLSLIMFDLDKFKHVNDTYGHLGGDLVLKKVAALVKQSLRQSDVAGRYGGEEFGIILPGTDKEGALVVAEKLRRLIENERTVYEGKTIRFTISGGIVEFAETHQRHEELISHADQALYFSKTHGRNQFTCYPLPASENK
jgi:diguanylate cyclase